MRTPYSMQVHTLYTCISLSTQQVIFAFNESVFKAQYLLKEVIIEARNDIEQLTTRENYD